MDERAYRALVDDLVDEEDELDRLVAGLDDARWSRPTPAEGWTVRDQVTHLAATEEWARASLEDPDRFRADLAAYTRDPAAREAGWRDGRLGRGEPDGVDTLSWWRASRRATDAALRAHEADDRVPWFGPDMSAASFATARLMETWAHGQDVADALGVRRAPSLRHVAEIGVRTRRFAYASRGLELPADDVRVELRAPDGSCWAWGQEDGPQRISGDALEWCLVVTQRRHPDDTRLVIVGDAATEWMSIAQAFAGPPTDQRRPAAQRGTSR